MSIYTKGKRKVQKASQLIGFDVAISFNKHLMTGPEGNSEFCFPETLNVGTLRVEGKQNSLFPEGPVIKCFVIPPNSKPE